MFNWRKRKQEPEKALRSLEQLRKQLRCLDAERQAEIKGGQGEQHVPPALKACGGWLPQ